jgi:hypothetical protein
MNERASLVEQYAMRGWSVFPCKVGEKQPATRSGLYAGTDDLVKLRFWWGKHDYNIGINCGVSGVVVVDLDVDKKHEDDLSAGINWWITVCDRLGEEPFTTYSVITPSGGLHLYFELPEGVTVPSKNGVLATHVDIKSNGGYVLAAGSIIETGDYEWIEPINEVMPAPDWLLAMVVEREPTQEEREERLRHRVQLTSNIVDDPMKAIRRRTERVLTAAPGQRNETLNAVAFSLFEAAPAHLLDMIWTELEQCGSAVGLSAAEIRDTLRSAYRAARGESPPR